MKALLYTVADIARVVYQNNLGSVVANQLSALLAYRVGHNYLGFVAKHRADKGEAYALISACWLNYYRVFVYNTASLGVFYHIVRGSRFY